MSNIRNNDSNETFKLSILLKAGFTILILLELIGPFASNSYGPDGGSHLYWIQQFIKLNAGGIFFPRWIPDGFSGFGSPSFYFYPPLTYYLASLVSIVSGLTTPTLLFQIISLIATIASFFTARMLLRSIGAPAPQSLIGAALYAFAPYRIAEIYSLSSLSSHVAFIFLPLVWCGLIWIFDSRRPSRNGMILFAISFALMTLSNIPITVLTVVTIVLAAAIFRNRISAKNVYSIAAGFGLAALLVSFYLVSIISYLPYIQLGYLSEQREFFLEDLLHLRNLPGLFHIALLYAAMAAIVIAYVKIHRKKEQISTEERALLRMVMALTALILVLEIPLIGRPVLSSVPVINLIQGTWRFYIDIVLLASCVVGIARSGSFRIAAKQIVWIWVAGAMLTMGPILFHVHLSTHQETRVADPPEYAPIYTLKNHDTLEAVFSPLTDMTPIVMPSNSGEETIALLRSSPGREVYAVNFGKKAAVTFHRFYWPAWHLYVYDQSSTVDNRSSINDSEIISLPDSIGRAEAMLPEGHYSIEWKLEKTPLERAGMWISGLTLCCIAFISGFGSFRRRSNGRRTGRDESTHSL